MREASLSRYDSLRGLIARPRARPLSQQEQIVRAIGIDIVSGLIMPGERIPAEADLLARFDVSRSVLREALKTLIAKGLLVVRAHVGAKVRDPAHWSILDRDLLAWRLEAGADPDFTHQLQEVQLSLEALAAELAAKRRTERDIASMSLALAAFERPKDLATAHLAFQATMTKASGNPVLQSICDLIDAALAAAPVPSGAAMHRPQSARAALVDCIVGGDETGAAALVRGSLLD